jgi:tetratricopeptide (TPR) repeat protein
MPTERTVLVRLRGNATDFNRTMMQAAAGVRALTKEIDTSNDRTTWLAQGIMAIAPAVVTMGATAIPLVSLLATNLTVAAGAAGVAGLAFNGIGDALKALNDYQLDPTEAHLEKLNETMKKIGPEGEEFVRFLDQLGPAYAELANLARGPIFEGVEDGLTSLTEDLLPRLKTITTEIAEGWGQLAGEAGEGLAGPRFEAFFEYLENEAKPLLLDMGHVLGNLAEGLGNLMVAFGPLTDQFSTGMVRMSRAFSQWSRGLDGDDSFQAFLAYIEKSGPLVMDFLAALIAAMSALIQAAAPVGDVLLPAFTALLRVIEAFAETPLGPMWLAAAAAASIYGRVVAANQLLTGGMMGKLTKDVRENQKAAASARFAWRDLGSAIMYAGHTQKDFAKLAKTGPMGMEDAARAMNARNNMREYGKQVAGTTAQLAGLAFVMSDTDEKLGLTNTAMLTLAGSMMGPYGAAAGAAIGFTMDLAKRNDELVASIGRVDAATKDDNLTKMLLERQTLMDEMADMAAKGNALGGSAIGQLTWLLGGEEDYEEAERKLAAVEERIDDMRTRLRGTGAAPGPRGMGQMFAGLDSEATQAALALEDLAEGIREVQGLLDKSGSLIAYERALDDLTKGIKDNGQAWDVGTEKGRANLELRNRLVETAIQRAQVLKDAGDDLGAQRILDRAISDLKTFAGESPKAKKAMQPLIEELRNLDQTRARPKVTVDTGNSLPEIAVVKTALDALRDRVIRLRVERQEVMLGPIRGATGGPVYGPGGPTDDRVPALLSNGEYVMRAAAVDKYGEKMMADINAMRFADGGLVRRFAGGGPVDVSARWSMDRLNAHLDKLTESLDRLRDEQREYRKAVASQFANDITGAGGLAAATSVLAGDISGARGMDRGLDRLRQLGLRRRSALYRELEQSNDVTLVAQLAAGGRDAVDSFEDLYRRRQRINRSRSAAAGDAQYGRSMDNVRDDIRETRKVMHRSERRLEDINKTLKDEGRQNRRTLTVANPRAVGREVARGVSSAAVAGRRRGSR